MDKPTLTQKPATVLMLNRKPRLVRGSYPKINVDYSGKITLQLKPHGSIVTLTPRVAELLASRLLNSSAFVRQQKAQG